MNADIPTVAPTRRDAMYYRMDHPKRGIALIFNHENYKHEYMPLRKGTEVDCMRLKQCLGKLEFDVKIYNDLGFHDLKDRLEAVSKMNHTEHDCLAVVVLTHGSQNTLCAYDTHYNTDIIWSYFTADECPTLAGKPKIFFMQACQGEKKDHGCNLMERTQTDCSSSSNDSQTFRIPCYADFLIVYSNPPGICSWLSPTKGSRFVLALCTELTDNGTQLDLLTLLTFVCQRVATKYQLKYDSIDLQGKKQVPCITSMLTRIIKF